VVIYFKGIVQLGQNTTWFVAHKHDKPSPQQTRISLFI